MSERSSWAILTVAGTSGHFIDKKRVIYVGGKFRGVFARAVTYNVRVVYYIIEELVRSASLFIRLLLFFIDPHFVVIFISHSYTPGYDLRRASILNTTTTLHFWQIVEAKPAHPLHVQIR